MNDRSIGQAFRAIRRSAGLRQVDVAIRAGLSQSEISDLELGRVAGMKVRNLRRCFAALDAVLVLNPYWRGGDLDRLIDEGHAALVARIMRTLERSGWVGHPEVTYAIYGERGSIDVLAWHPRARMLLVVEVKTEIASVEETLRRHDAKVRLAPRIWRERAGTASPRSASPATTLAAREASGVSSLLVVADSSTNRRRATRHAAVFVRRYPCSGATVRSWLRAPDGMLHGMMFLRPAAP